MSESAPKDSIDILTAERALLLPIRKRHATELLRSGLLNRLFASYFGQGVTMAPINESDEFVPFRMAVPDMLIARTVATDGRIVPINSQQSVEGTSYNMNIHRTFQSVRGYEHKAYFVGNVVDRELASILSADTVLPAIGFLREDVEQVAAQLKEVEDAVQTHGLTTLNPELLMEEFDTYHIRKSTLP